LISNDTVEGVIHFSLNIQTSKTIFGEVKWSAPVSSSAADGTFYKYGVKFIGSNPNIQ